MNHLVGKKIQAFERISNKSEKIEKIKECLEFIIYYYATIFYCHTKEKKLISKDIVELIQTGFHKRDPLLSSWVKLLKFSLNLLKLEKNFDKKSSDKIQIIANHFLLENSKREIVQNPNIKIILDSFLIIRNKFFAHSVNKSQEDFDVLLKNNFNEFPYDLDSFFSTINSSEFLISETIYHAKNDGQEYDGTFFDYTTDICKIKNIPFEICEINNIYAKNSYCYFPKEEIFISTSPFMIYKNKDFFIYSGSTKKNLSSEYTEIFASKKIEQQNESFEELIKEDINLINSSSITILQKCDNGILHNVPDPPYEKFIGRKNTIGTIIKALENKRIFLVGISGIGGVGKSALAIKTARDLIEADKKMFEYMIWVSAKKSYLTSKGIRAEEQIFSNLGQLLDVILKITGFNEALDLNSTAKKQYVLEILSLCKFLIIVDNFETLPNPSEFLAFFEDIGDKCDETKIILTTRHQLGSSEKIIDLTEFTDVEYKDFINYLIKEKFKIDRKISDRDISSLFSITGGLPLATEFIIGQISRERSLKQICSSIKSNEKLSKDNILEFSYSESFSLLNERERKILFSVSLLDFPDINNISFLTELDEIDLEDIIAKFIKLSFINKNYKNNTEIFTILPLTKIFLEKKLSENSNLASQLNAKFEEYKFVTTASRQIEKDIDLDIDIESKNKLASISSKAAFKLAMNNDFQKSEEYFNRAIFYAPNESLVWYLRAKAASQYSNIIKDEYFEKAIEYALDKDKEKILLEYGRILLNATRHKDSIIKLNHLLEINNNNNNAYHLLGKAYFEIGKNIFQKQKISTEEMRKNYLNSKKAFEKSFYESPNSEFEINHNTVGYYYLIKISRYLHKWEDAENYLQKGLLLQPNNSKLKQLQYN